MSRKLVSRKRSGRPQESRNNIFGVVRIPASEANISRASTHRSHHPLCALALSYHHGQWRKPRKSAVIMWTVSIFLLNAIRISVLWPKPYIPNPYHYKPKDRREGVYPRLIRYTMDDSRHFSIQILDAMADYDVSSTRQLHLHLPKWKLISLHRSENGDSSDNVYDLADPFETEQCQAQYQWQLATYPTCNILHELDMTRLNDFSPRAARQQKPVVGSPRLKHLAHGYWRDIWSATELNFDHQQQQHNKQQTKHEIYKVVLKTMRYRHNFVERNYDRHRRDALAAERLTKSSYVVDIYGFCGNSGLFEYGNGGDIANAIWSKDHNLTNIEKLALATQAASGLAAFHNIDKEGQASIAHTDISPGQFIKINNTFKLNDFNRARFLRWNAKKDEPCGYYVDRNPGRNRSPEEYSYKVQSEKVDVYSLGNIFYMLLQRDWPFSEVEDKEARRLVKEGFRPSFDAAVWNSTDPVDMALKEAMIMCHEQEPETRASARQVESYLKLTLEGLYPSRAL